MLVTARKDGRPKKEDTEKNLKKPNNNLDKTQTKPNKNLNYNYNLDLDYNSNLDLNNKKIKYRDYVSMEKSEYEKLVEQYGKDFTERCLDILDNYKGANGKKYKSDYRAILNWVVDRCKKDGNKPVEQTILNELYEN